MMSARTNASVISGATQHNKQMIQSSCEHAETATPNTLILDLALLHIEPLSTKHNIGVLTKVQNTQANISSNEHATREIKRTYMRCFLRLYLNWHAFIMVLHVCEDPVHLRHKSAKDIIPRSEQQTEGRLEADLEP